MEVVLWIYLSGTIAALVMSQLLVYGLKLRHVSVTNFDSVIFGVSSAVWPVWLSCLIFFYVFVYPVLRLARLFEEIEEEP